MDITLKQHYIRQSVGNSSPKDTRKTWISKRQELVDVNGVLVLNHRWNSNSLLTVTSCQYQYEDIWIGHRLCAVIVIRCGANFVGDDVEFGGRHIDLLLVTLVRRLLKAVVAFRFNIFENVQKASLYENIAVYTYDKVLCEYRYLDTILVSK